MRNVWLSVCRECLDSGMRYAAEWREIRKCACGCGEFPVNRPWQKFKSPACRVRAWRKRKEADHGNSNG